MDEPNEDQAVQKVAESISRKCVFCGMPRVLNRIGACSSCTEHLMQELLKTREWKKSSEIISKEIKGQIANHESKKHR